jgi:hypothetical protein
MVYAYLHKNVTPFWQEMGREPQVVLYLGRAAAGVLEIESGRQ